MYQVAVLVGSLREQSLNRRFAEALEQLAKPQFAFHFVRIGNLPMYNDDLWAEPPAPVLRMKGEIRQSDAVLFVTPEYNRSVPAVLKNAIDWGTRPKGDNCWTGKPAAIAGASPGAIGTAAAQTHLRSIAPVIELALMGQPEVYFASNASPIDEAGRFENEATRVFLKGFLDRFDSWIARVRSPHCPPRDNNGHPS